MHSSFGKLLVSKWCESEDSFDAVHCWTPLYGIGFTFILPQGIAASEIMIVDGKMSLLTRHGSSCFYGTQGIFISHINNYEAAFIVHLQAAVTRSKLNRAQKLSRRRKGLFSSPSSPFLFPYPFVSC